VHYIIREKGKIELGIFSCAMCHTRVMADGTTIKERRETFRFCEPQRIRHGHSFHRHSCIYSPNFCTVRRA
jgi:hypothetical protein